MLDNTLMEEFCFIFCSLLEPLEFIILFNILFYSFKIIYFFY